MDDQRAVVGVQHPDLDQIDGPVGTEEQGDIVVTGIGCDGDEVAQGVADAFVGDARKWNARDRNSQEPYLPRWPGLVGRSRVRVAAQSSR